MCNVKVVFMRFVMSLVLNGRMLRCLMVRACGGLRLVLKWLLGKYCAGVGHLVPEEAPELTAQLLPGVFE
jgi:hypothetical protein